MIESALHIVEVSREDFRPSASELRLIANYLHIESFRIIDIYQRRLNWKDEENEDYPITSYEHLSIEEGIALYHDYLTNYTIDQPMWMFADFNTWAEKFANHFNSIPLEVSGGFAPADFSFYIGKTDIPSIDFERVQLTSTFQLKMGGNYNPNDINEYISNVCSDEMFKDLFDFLSSLREGLQFRVVLSMYY